MNPVIASRPRHWRGIALALLLSTPLLASAGRKEADLAMTQARGAVAAAERSGAPQAAPIEMKIARDALTLASNHYDGRDWRDVERWAERAQHDALLAEARARQSRAEALTAEIEATIRTLQLEIGG